MNPTYRRPFFLEDIAERLLHAYRENKVPFLSGVIFGLLAHLFAFANKLVGYDEVGSLFNKGTTATSGRWGLDLLSLIFPDISMPWIYGILSILILSAAAAITVRIFQIQSPVLQSLLAGSILAFPSVTATVIYLYTLSSYAVSFLLAVASVAQFRKDRKWDLLLGIGFLTLSVGIYQSYIAIAASFLVLLLIQDLLNGAEAAATFHKGIKFLVLLILSLGSYYGITQAVNHFSGAALNDYASARIQFSLSYLPTGIVEAYKAFARFFLEGYWGLIPTSFSQVIHCLCLLAVVGLLILWFCRQETREPARLALLALLIALLPLAINCIYLFVSADPALTAIHTLVLYGFITVYVFAAVVAQCCDLPQFFKGKALPALTRLSQNTIALGLALALAVNIYVANGTYLSLHLRYENAYAFYTSVLSDLRQFPEFTRETPVAVVGTWQEPNFYDGDLDFTYRIMGADGFQPHSYTRWFFLQYYVGHSINLLSDQESAALARNEAVAAMPCYPSYGSIAQVGDTIVIKLS